MQSQMQSQGIALPPEVKVGPSASCVNTKKSYVDSSRQDSETWDSNKRGLYADDSPPRLVVVGRVYKGSMTVHNIPLGNDQLKLGVDKVRHADARVSVLTQEV